MDILERSWQDLVKILSRSCHGNHFAMVRSYQVNHVPKSNFIVKFYFTRTNLERSHPKSTSMQIYIVIHDSLPIAMYKI